MANQTIIKRQQKEKELLIENLKRVPIVEAACSKSQISRATFYRWKVQDREFAQLADEALAEGYALVNDMAEGKILAAIKNDNLTAAMYWLNHRHSAYINKLEVLAKIQQSVVLTPEQEKLIVKALRFASMLPTPEKNDQQQSEGKQNERV